MTRQSAKERGFVLIPFDHCPGDIAGPGGIGLSDGLVNVSDLLVLLGAWGDVSSCHPADLNRDGTVNVSDMLILLGNWGMCDGYPEPSEPPLSLAGTMAAAGLTMQAWDDYVDVMTGESARAKANWSCWMENYLSGCTTCPPCPGPDPFINY